MPSDFEQVLKNHNLSVTAVRLALLNALHDHPHSPAEKIYELVNNKIASASRQAIYNNLAKLTEVHLIREIKPMGLVSRYELAVNDSHHHLICRSCNLIVDTNRKTSAPPLQPDKAHGFALDQTEVFFWGVCPACQQNPPS